jgi:hypothetical protein
MLELQHTSGLPLFFLDHRHGAAGLGSRLASRSGSGGAQRALCRHAESRARRMLRVKQFIDDDSGYLRWIENNPNGFVVNCHKRPYPKYLILHHATCLTISTPANTNWTTTNYMKICSLDRNELQNWAQNKIHGRLHLCKICNP